MKASVIVLSWNGMADLRECLDAVRSQDFTDFEIIVVDNGSTDGSADFVASHYPGVRLIRTERNLGFAAGNNQGLRVGTGDVLVLLNQDTVVQAGWLKGLVEAVVSDATCGIAGGKALYPDGRIQHAGGRVDERGCGSHYGYRQRDVGQCEQVQDVEYVTGATLAISRAASEVIGGLDEGFGCAYYEDVDWCYRAKEAGFRVVYTPHAVLIHKESSAAADLSHEGMYYFQRNRLRFVLKHWSTERLVEEFLPAERSWLKGLDAGSERLIAAAHHAYLYHLLHLNDLIEWRMSALGTQEDDAEALAKALVDLRVVVPIILGQASREARAGVARESALVAELRSREVIREQPARSQIPVLGRILTAFRGPWNRAVTAAYVLPMAHQQTEFNTRVVTLLEQLTQARVYAMLSEYLSEDGRELAELARELDQLRTLVGKKQPHD
jgi:GT2 family glycosyltransferase